MLLLYVKQSLHIFIIIIAFKKEPMGGVSNFGLMRGVDGPTQYLTIVRSILPFMLPNTTMVDIIILYSPSLFIALV